MTEQQKQAVEAAAKEYALKAHQSINDIGVSDIKALVYDYMSGMHQVLNNPSKYGLQPINEWVSVSDRLPMAWEVGNWDGKRTDEVLIRKTDGKYAVGRMYTGVIDGVEFSDWSEGREEWLINTKDITHWKPINEREEG